KQLAGRAVAGWTRLLASLGRTEKLAELYAEAKRLGLDRGVQAPILQYGQEGLLTMKARPDLSYRCGSFALAHTMCLLQPANTNWQQVQAAASPENGFRLYDLAEMARTNGFEMLPVLRSSGTDIVVPSVVHWKLDHYAAIVEKKADE